MLDIFNNDAFSLTRLTATVNNMDHVPGRAGELTFMGTGEGVDTLTVAIEQINQTLSLIPTTPRHAPAPKEKEDKRTIRSIDIPQIKLEETIQASRLQNVRSFGSNDSLQGAQSVMNTQLRKIMGRHDLTLEHHRLGALRGVILDADGSTLLNLFSAFGVTQPDVVDFGDILVPTTEDTGTEELGVREIGQQIARTMKRNLKGGWPGGARIWAFAGDNFFDRLTNSQSVKGAYDGYALAEQRLGESYSHGVYYHGGIFYENYQGTDDNSTVAIASNDCQFFPVGVPGLYVEYYAPADFLETANTVGLPRYAKIAPGDNFNRTVAIHTQQNPLPLCTKPGVLVRGTIGAVS